MLAAFRRHAPAAAILTVAWTLLVLAGLPEPSIDDVWYVDPAISVALTGRLEAPVLARVLQAFGTRRFFLSFPLHPYLLGLWFRVLGVSFASAAAFWAVCGIVASLALRELLREFGAGAWAQTAVLLYFPLQMHFYGLRPEPAGYAFCFLAAALYTRPTLTRSALGALAVCASVLSAPNFVAIAPGLALTALYPLRKTPGLARRLAFTGAGALALATGLFTLAIGARFADFARQVSAMSHVTFTRSQTLAFIAEQLVGHGFAKLRMGPLYTAYLALVVFTLTRARRLLPARVRAFVLGTGLTLVATIAFRGRSFDVLNPALFGSLLLAAPTLAPLLGRVVVAGTIACVGVSSAATTLVSLVLTRPADPAALARARRSVSELRERVVLDEFSARYVFDFRYPRDAISFHHQRALDDPAGFEARAEFKRPGEAWVVSRANLCKLTPSLAVDDCERLTLFGRKLTNSYANEREIAVLE